ncbi:hypothetical protein N9P82_00870 [bacterium]|nr:hypothetical protein [bacterium]
MEDIHKQFIMYQLFKALKYMHSAELLHRDVKVWTSVHASPCFPLTLVHVTAEQSSVEQRVSNEDSRLWSCSLFDKHN